MEILLLAVTESETENRTLSDIIAYLQTRVSDLRTTNPRGTYLSDLNISSSSREYLVKLAGESMSSLLSGLREKQVSATFLLYGQLPATKCCYSYEEITPGL